MKSMPSLNWKQGTLEYTDEGKGTTIILLHGFCESKLLWDDWKDDLLEENYRVITIDLPGFGESKSAKTTSIITMAEAVIALTSALKVKKGVCIGHSMGGYVSLEVARLMPKWLIGLGLFHSHPYADNEEQKLARQKSIEFIERNGHVHYVKQLIPRLFAQRAGTSASFRRDMLILRASRAGADNIINALEAMRDRRDNSEFLADFPYPVLFINGQKDPIYSSQQRQDQLALPALAEVSVLQRSGHMGMIEEKQITQRSTRHFVRFCERWASH